VMREDWVEVELGRVCETTSGGTPSRRNKNYFLGNIPWVKSGELRYNIIFDTEEHISEEAVKKSSAKVFPQGTLLIALYGATIGKLAILGVQATTNQAVCGIFENGLFQTKFLFNYLFHIKQKLIEQGMGGAQPNISQTILKKLFLPIAPLPEQRAIVAKIEQLFSELDNGITNLKAAKAKLVIYRQAVLKKAFEGKLSGLGCNGLKDERIIEKETKEEILQSKNPKDPNPDNEGSNLPKGWKWVKLGDIAEMCLGKMLDKAKNTGEFRPYLGNINVRWGAFDLTNLKSMRFEKSEEERYEIKWGDLVVCEGGEPGRCAVWTKSFPINIQKALHRVRFQTNHHPFYFHYYFNFIAAVGKLEKHFTGTTIKHLTGRKLREINISIPSSFKAQIQIVQEIETRLSVCDNILRNIEEGLEKAEALRQSILKKAFEGKLLNEMELAACRQQPDWEPAEKLLARIRRDAMHRVSTTKRAPTHEWQPRKQNKNQI